jgi:hypothetical protein
MLITGRFADAFKRQDWATVLIELILVVVGVLIALRLDQLAEDRRVRAQEINFLKLVSTDISRDIDDLENIDQVMTAVRDFGDEALATLADNSCEAKCWTKLVTFFYASQWMDVRLNTATYEEIKRTGFPGDPELKDELSRYYSLGEQRYLVANLPQYREIVRLIIPVTVQDYLWENGWEISGRSQKLIADREASICNAEARQIIDQLQADRETEKTLRFWLSTVTVIKKTVPPQIVESDQLNAKLSEHIENME